MTTIYVFAAIGYLWYVLLMVRIGYEIAPYVFLASSLVLAYFGIRRAITEVDALTFAIHMVVKDEIEVTA